MPECTLRHHMQSHSNPDGNLDYAKVHGLQQTFRQPKKHPYEKPPVHKHRNKHPKSQNQHITHMQIHSANYVQGMYTDGDLCGHTHACLSEHRHTHARTHAHTAAQTGTWATWRDLIILLLLSWDTGNVNPPPLPNTHKVRPKP